jgi:hypothetical protein
VLGLQPPASKPSAKPTSEKAHRKVKKEKVKKATSTVLRMQLLRANPAPKITGANLLPGQVNYLQGKDPSKCKPIFPPTPK